MLKTSYPFTRSGHSSIEHAKHIASQNKQQVVDSLMLLLALLQLPNSRVQAVLKLLNVKVESLAARLQATIKLEAKQISIEPVTSVVGDEPAGEYESVLTAAFAEMQQRGQTDIDEITLLLGMLQSPESKAGQILSQYMVTAEQVRERIPFLKDISAFPKKGQRGSLFLGKAMRQGLSPVFISLVLFTAAMAAFLWLGIGNNPRAFIMAFVMGGWIISVALHEFGHAVTAFWGGDESVEQKGYLTLNPLKYSNPFLSVIIPVLLLLMGGIGFPGGAVYINIYALRKPVYRSLVSVAGPIANLLVFILLAIPFGDLPYFLFSYTLPTELLSAVAFLAFLQVTSIVINLLPIPGLDGFGILEPYLPREFVEFTGFLRLFGFFVLYLFIFIESPISDLFWSNIWLIIESVSPNLAYYANEGLRLFLAR